MNSSQNKIAFQNGFTLLEVMIAMVVFSIGLLGLASLQAISMQNEHASYSRSQAILLAYEMADRITATPSGSVSYVIAANTTAVAGYTGTAMCTANNCTTTDMVKYDLGLWKSSIASLLVSGKGSIARDVTLGVVTHTITVHWDEDRTGVTGLNCPVAGAGDLRCFQLAVRL